VRPSPADRESPRHPSETGRLYKASRGDPRRHFPYEIVFERNAPKNSRVVPVSVPLPNLV
jgi:hypothetical protein